MKGLKNRRAGWTAVLVVASAAIAGTVFVATGTAGKFATGTAGKSKVTYVNVGGAAFNPNDSDCSSYEYNGSGELEATNDCDFGAHSDLPDGAKIVSITAYYRNQNGDATFRFQANDDVGAHVDLVNDSLDGSAGGAVCDVDNHCAASWEVANQEVNNNTIHYSIYLDAQDDFFLYRFKIKLKPA
jgi:hypothetical protein